MIGRRRQTRTERIAPVHGGRRAFYRRRSVHAREYYIETLPSGRKRLRVRLVRASRRAWHRLVIAFNKEHQA